MSRGKFVYKDQSDRSFKKIMQLMATEDDEQMEEFFKLMMSSYKMEMKPPREFNKNDLKNFIAPVILFASDDDIFSPAKKSIPKSKRDIRYHAGTDQDNRKSSAIS